MLGVLLGASLVSGCAKTKDAPLAISTAKSAAPEPTYSRKDPVEATLGFSRAVNKAEQALDENYPGLAIYGEGPALADIVTHVKMFRAQGLRLGKPRVVTHAGLNATGTDKGKRVASVTACVTEPADDLVDAKTGKPRPPSGATSQPAVTLSWTAIVVLNNDGWHVDSGTLKDTATC
ncbi:MAG: hypothetical protein DLM59_09030 [Pseudonocardiales bacterium]|nr:MAG: hypothetical protein DLM59_09030 [Pseudonocardiales bacterium]